METEKTPDTVYLIKIIELDSLENEVSAAVTYEPFGFVPTEEEAIEFCAKGRTYTQKDCWAIYGKMPEFKYEEIKRI